MDVYIIICRQHFAASCLKNGWTDSLPELIHVSPKQLVPMQIDHTYVVCEHIHRLACFKYLLRKELSSWFNYTCGSGIVSDMDGRNDERSDLSSHIVDNNMRDDIYTKLNSFYHDNSNITDNLIDCLDNSNMMDNITEKTHANTKNTSGFQFKAMVFIELSDPIHNDIVIDNQSKNNDKGIISSIKSILDKYANNNESHISILTENMNIDLRAKAMQTFRYVYVYMSYVY